MSTATQLVTVEEFLKMRDPKEGRLELHHGEVVIVPPPKWIHQSIQARIVRLLFPFLGHLGELFTEMAFQPTPEFEVWCADVGFARRGRLPSPFDYLSGAPDLVAEVLSPSNTMDEMHDRMAICLDNGCTSFWIVDPKRQRVSVTEGNITRHYNRGDSVVCQLFSGAISVDEIFA